MEKAKIRSFSLVPGAVIADILSGRLKEEKDTLQKRCT